MTDYNESEVRRYLQSYQRATRNIESLIAEKERIESQVYSITASTGGEGGGDSAVECRWPRRGQAVRRSRAHTCRDSRMGARQAEVRVINRVGQANDIWANASITDT